MTHNNPFNPVNQTTPIDGLALVTEGGGQRGVFTAGVLDSWLLSRFNPFELLIGTSAGAQNIASYLCQQVGYAYSAITHLTAQPRFFNFRHLFSGESLMNLDWYFEQIKTPEFKLDTQTAERQIKNRRAFFTATDLHSMQTHLLNPKEIGWSESLKASSSIPYLFSGITIAKKKLVDGGVTSPIPVKEAYRLGAKTIVSIRTSQHVDSKIGNLVKKTKPIFCGKNGCANFINIVENHESAYRASQAFSENPPSGVNVIEISPPRALKSRVLNSKPEELVEDYKLGVNAGLEFLKHLNKQQLQLH